MDTVVALLSKAIDRLAIEDDLLEKSIIDVDKRLALSNVLHDAKFDALNAKVDALLLLVTSSLCEKAGLNWDALLKEAKEDEEKATVPVKEESPATLIFCDLCKKNKVRTDLQLHDFQVVKGCECSECKNFLYCKECTINIYAAVKSGEFRCLSCLSKKRLECPCENTPTFFCPGEKCERKGCRNCFLLITFTNGTMRFWYCPDCWRLALGK